MTDNDTDRAERGVATGATAGAAIYAYFSADLLDVAPAWIKAMLGTLLGMGVAALWLGALLPMKSRLFWAIAVFSALVGIIGLLVLGGWSVDQSRVNETRCANIQREMLFPKPRRDDLPDLFSALKCRPQGTDDIQIPKSASPQAALTNNH